MGLVHDVLPLAFLWLYRRVMVSKVQDRCAGPGLTAVAVAEVPRGASVVAEGAAFRLRRGLVRLAFWGFCFIVGTFCLAEGAAACIEGCELFMAELAGFVLLNMSTAKEM